MTIVHVWGYLGKDLAWGHASMHCDDTYISWWPEETGRIHSKVNQNIFSISPIRNQTYFNDQFLEGSGGIAKPPDHNIMIQGLDGFAIKQWWSIFGLMQGGHQLLGPLLPWYSLKQNCSTVVATALTIGGGAKQASWLNPWNLVWTPKKVQDFAEDI